MKGKWYEINGSVFTDPRHTIGDCYTLTKDGERDLTDTIKYKDIGEALKIREATSWDRYVAITIYEWYGNSISNVFFIK